MSEIPLSLSEHASHWQHINTAIANQRMPQALLLVGARHVNIPAFGSLLASTLLCHAETKPCHQCASCALYKADTHPDYKRIRAETPSGVIKIDQVRDLQEEIYQTPNSGECRVVLMDGADRMNLAAANALLKILEEPPSSVYFILMAETQSRIPATILSRCQKMLFADTKFNSFPYLSLGEYYEQESSRGKLWLMRSSIMTSLCELIEGKISPCSVSVAWEAFDLEDILWILHLITAQAIRIKLTGESVQVEKELQQLVQIAHPIGLLMQLETIGTISKKLSHNISMNSLLTLEDLLLGYHRSRHG